MLSFNNNFRIDLRLNLSFYSSESRQKLCHSYEKCASCLFVLPLNLSRMFDIKQVMFLRKLDKHLLLLVLGISGIVITI